jgi:hypothetical protein
MSLLAGERLSLTLSLVTGDKRRRVDRVLGAWPITPNGDLALAPQKWASAQAARHALRSDCQQISAHPSEGNASWMSVRLSYRTRRRRN